MGRIKFLTIECFSKVLSLAQWPTLARERVGWQTHSLRHLHLPKPMMGPYGALFSFCFKGV
jgi:hypothetical protein